MQYSPFFTTTIKLISLINFYLCIAPLCLAQTPHKPALTLANTYNAAQHINLNEYWVSEKLDGIRGYWTGKEMLTRQGNRINLPPTIKDQLPKIALDGELWVARNTFDRISGLTRRKHTSIQEWQNDQGNVTYNVFDLPHHEGTFDQRLATLNTLYRESKPHNNFWRPIKQFKVTNHTQLLAQLKTIEELGGEGLMLHKGSSLYHATRNNDLLKVKSFSDAEAVVVAHQPGKGKYTGLLGSVSVQTPSGIRFNIGTGFSDSERANPPPIGSIITYKYYGTTHKGTPRFASFLRVRAKAESKNSQ